MSSLDLGHEAEQRRKRRAAEHAQPAAAAEPRDHRAKRRAHTTTVVTPQWFKNRSDPHNATRVVSSAPRHRAERGDDRRDAGREEVRVARPRPARGRGRGRHPDKRALEPWRGDRDEEQRKRADHRLVSPHVKGGTRARAARVARVRCEWRVGDAGLVINAHARTGESHTVVRVRCKRRVSDVDDVRVTQASSSPLMPARVRVTRWCG